MLSSVSDAFTLLVDALSTASYETAEFAQAYINPHLNWITAGMLADVLHRDQIVSGDAYSQERFNELRLAIMLLTPEQFAVILQAAAHGEAAALAERAQHDGTIPASWGSDSGN